MGVKWNYVWWSLAYPLEPSSPLLQVHACMRVRVSPSPAPCVSQGAVMVAFCHLTSPFSKGETANSPDNHVPAHDPPTPYPGQALHACYGQNSLRLQFVGVLGLRVVVRLQTGGIGLG